MPNQRYHAHELDRLPASKIILSSLAAVGLLASVLLGFWIASHFLAPTGTRKSLSLLFFGGNPAAHHVRPDQAQRRRNQQAQQAKHLQNYGGIDPTSNTARVPIDRAIELMAERRMQPPWESPSGGDQ